jgi:hypothetical protein
MIISSIGGGGTERYMIIKYVITPDYLQGGKNSCSIVIFCGIIGGSSRG